MFIEESKLGYVIDAQMRVHKHIRKLDVFGFIGLQQNDIRAKKFSMNLVLDQE